MPAREKAHYKMFKSGKFWVFATVTAFTAAAAAQTNRLNWLPMGQGMTAAASDSTIQQQGQTVALPTGQATKDDSQVEKNTAQTATAAVKSSDSSKQSSAQSSLSSNKQATDQQTVTTQTQAADDSKTSTDQSQSGQQTQTATSTSAQSGSDQKQQTNQNTSNQPAASTSFDSSDQLTNRMADDNNSGTTSTNSSENNGANNSANSTDAKGKALVPDDTLRTALAQAANVSADDLTADQLANLKALKITSGKITSLQGLEYAKSLESLTIIGSGKQDVDESDNTGNYSYMGFYQESQPSYQYATDKGTADVSAVLNDEQLQPLNQLSKLKFIQLTGLGIQDPKLLLHQIQSKQNLETAFFDKNELDNMNAFQGIHMDQLKTLSLAANNITDISVMKDLDLPQLKGLDLSYNQISDVSPITQSKLTSVQVLLADHNRIQNVDAFKDSTFTNLHWLSARDNQIQNIAIMKGLSSRYPNLHTYRIDHNEISDTTPMDGYNFNSDTSAYNQDYNQQVTLVKPSEGQKVEIPMPIKTIDIQWKDWWHGNSDPSGQSLHLSNLPESVTEVRLYDGSIQSVADAEEDNDNDDFTGVKSFLLPVKTNQALPQKFSFSWAGAAYRFTGTANLTLNWVDSVAPVLNASDQTISAGDQFNPLTGVTAYDQQQDGSAQVDLTNDIQVVDNQVNSEQPGQYTVHYQVKNSRGLTTDKTITVTVVARGPLGPDSPDLPDSVKKELTKDVTRTVNFIDDKGNVLAPTQQATVHFQRTASYQEAQKQYVPNNDWHVVGEPSTFAAVDVNQAVDSSQYETAKITVNGQKAAAVTAETPTADSANENILVTYQDKISPVGPNTPNMPKKVTDNLSKDVTRTVTFVDARGNSLAAAEKATVHLERTADYNYATGEVSYHNDWHIVGETGSFSAVDVDQAVDSSKYVDPKITINGKEASAIESETPTAESADENIVVTYQDKTSPVGPNTPNVPKTVTDNLSKDVTRTVNFVDAQGHTLAPAEKTTVHLERTADYNFATGEVSYHNDWHTDGQPSVFAAVDVEKAVDAAKYADPKITINGKEASAIGSETPTADSADENIVVTYQDKTVPVGPNTPNVPKTVTDNLSKDVTRTVNFVDAQGNTLAAAEKTTVHLERMADYNFATGAVSYYNDWHVVGNPSSFAAVDVNQVVDGNKYKDPKITINGKDATAIVAEAPTADSNDENIVVTYQHQADKSKKVTPDNPGSVDVNTLKKAVTRTIQYENQGGQELATPVIETVHFTRAAIVDETTNQVLSYTDWQASENPVWEAKISPDLSDKGYDAPSEQLVSSQNVTADTQNTSLVVTYKVKDNPTPTPNNGGGNQPANGGNNTPSNGGGNQPANGGDNTPSNGGDNQPANGGDNTPSNGGDNQPANGGNNTPNNGGGNQPANGGNNTPSNGGGNTPANGGNNTPSNGGGNQPANGGDNTPSNGGGTKPANGGNNTPSNGGGNQPANGGNNTPSNGGGNQPANGGNTPANGGSNTPSNGGDNQPANGGNNAPNNGGGNQPANGGNNIPSNGGDNQPSNGGNNTPSNGGGGQPANGGDNTPSNAGDNQPANGGNNKPSNGGGNQPAKSGDNTPSNGGGNQPAKSGDNTPSNGGGNQPAKGGDNTPNNGGGNQPANGGNNTPSNGGDNQPANGGNNKPSNGGNDKSTQQPLAKPAQSQQPDRPASAQLKQAPTAANDSVNKLSEQQVSDLPATAKQVDSRVAKFATVGLMTTMTASLALWFGQPKKRQQK
ncbi:DUF5011 domain-containing protein [Leuconostocaceae bacterium ESL0958]|nr:DUF5011 domain-containing protein [Leuconostocaceae bacterium ESL0958]